jgi:hypothetical protein
MYHHNNNRELCYDSYDYDYDCYHKIDDNYAMYKFTTSMSTTPLAHHNNK